MDSAETGGFGGSLDVEVRGDNEADVATATQDVQDALEDARIYPNFPVIWQPNSPPWSYR